jgi:hypothetical protein
MHNGTPFHHKILPFSAMQMELEDTMLKPSQTQKAKFHVILLI